MNNEQLAVMEKIAKLLAKADSTTHPAEAETAKRLAASLMAKHQIESITTKDPEKFHKVHKNLDRKNVLKYDSVLQNTLAEFCGVKYYRQQGGRTVAQHVYIGRECDLQSFFHLVDIIYIQREREWKAYPYRRNVKRGEWLLGYAYGVCDKLDELKSMENAEVTERGLVPVSMAKQAAEWFESDNRVGNPRSSHSRYNHDGYEAGLNAELEA